MLVVTHIPEENGRRRGRLALVFILRRNEKSDGAGSTHTHTHTHVVLSSCPLLLEIENWEDAEQ